MRTNTVSTTPFMVFGRYGMVDRNATQAYSANTIYWFPFQTYGDWTPSAFAIVVQTASAGSSVYAWIYAANTNGANTGAPVLDITSVAGFNSGTTGTKTISGFSTTIPAGNYVVVLGFTAGITLTGAGVIHPYTDSTPANQNTWLYRRAATPPTTAPNPLTSWDTASGQTSRSHWPIFWR